MAPLAAGADNEVFITDAAGVDMETPPESNHDHDDLLVDDYRYEPPSRLCTAIPTTL